MPPPHPQDRIGGFRNKSVLWRRYYRVIFFAILFLKHNSHMAQYFPKIYRESSILFKKNRFNDPILGPPQLGGCLKRGGVQSFCPIKSTFIHFSRFFLLTAGKFLSYLGGWVFIAWNPKNLRFWSWIGRVFCINFTVYIFYVFFLHFRKKT